MRVRLKDKVRIWPETPQKASQGHGGHSLFHPRPMPAHLRGLLGHREHRTTVNMIYKFKWKKRTSYQSEATLYPKAETAPDL